MSAPGSYGKLREALESERAKREEWRKCHRVQVALVENALPTARFALLILFSAAFSPILVVGWAIRWILTGETWPLRSEP